MKTEYSDHYQQELQSHSAALIDLAEVLTKYIPTTFTPRQIDVLTGTTMQEINVALKMRQQTLAQYEKDWISRQAADKAKEKLRTVLQAIVAQLPATWEAKVEDDHYGDLVIKGHGCSLAIKTRYSRYSFHRSEAAGLKLVASVGYESRSFPQKKDGSFNVDKAIAFIQQQTKVQDTKDEQLKKNYERLVRFQALVEPYVTYRPYKAEQQFRLSGTEELLVKRTYADDDQYMIQRTTTEVVTAEQLKQILANEVKPVTREEVTTAS